MGSNDLYLNVGRKNCKTASAEAIKQAYELAEQARKKEALRLQTLLENGEKWKVLAKSTCKVCGKRLSEADNSLFFCTNCVRKNK